MIADADPNTSTTMWDRIRGAVASAFGKPRYDAAETSTRRSDAGSRVKSADDILVKPKRDRLTANAREARRNFAIAAWMIRRHLDYVTSFSFQPATGIEPFDAQWLKLMNRWSRRQNCDVSQRRPMQTLLRMMEAGRTVDGDMLVVRLRSLQLQALPGDLIRDPTFRYAGQRPDHLTHGVQHDNALRHIRYAVHDRDQYGNYTFARWVPVRNAYLLGYHEDFDQVRGVSPLTTALNPLRDLYEGFEYALAKMKVAQLFGLAIYRQVTGDEDPLPAPETEDEEAADDNGEKYQVDFGKGPLKLELDPGDRAEFLEAKSPSSQFQNFSKWEVAVALKSLDIPYSFYDESATNFYGSRAAAMQYERSCRQKRTDLRDLLAQITAWLTVQWVRDRRLILPTGITLQDVLDAYEWIHEGTPWWKPLEETSADRGAIRAGFKTHDQTTRERLGKPFRQIIDELAAEYDYARQRGVQLDTMATTAPDTEPTNP